MGAWGYEPMEDDTALDWLADRVEAPILAAVNDAMQAYLDDTAYSVKQANLCSVAITVINKIIAEEADWLSGWNDPQQKVAALRRLISDLQRIGSG